MYTYVASLCLEAFPSCKSRLSGSNQSTAETTLASYNQRSHALYPGVGCLDVNSVFWMEEDYYCSLSAQSVMSAVLHVETLTPMWLYVSFLPVRFTDHIEVSFFGKESL